MNDIKGNKILKEYEGKLSWKAIGVFKALVSRSNEEDSCFPSLMCIHKDTGLSRSTVQRGLQELLNEGLIIKQHNFRNDGSQSSNTYTIVADVTKRIEAAKHNIEQHMLAVKEIRERKEASRLQMRMSLEEVVENDDICTKQEKKTITSILSELLKFKHLNRGLVLSEHQNSTC